MQSLASASSKGSSFTESPIFTMPQHISHKDKGITRAYADIKLTVTNAEEEGDVTDHATLDQNVELVTTIPLKRKV